MRTSLQNDPRFEHLYNHNTEFRELSDTHRKLQREADKLGKGIYFSPDEERKIHEVKKRKLEIKDRLESMLESVEG